MSRVALVSGGNRGIGLAVVRGLAEAGLTTIAGARDAAATVDDAIAASEVQQLDITDAASVERAIAAIEKRHGRLDVLVNSAGVLLDSGLSAATPDLDLVRATLEVNLIGTWRVTAAALPLLRRAPEGRIVSLTSGMGSLTDMGTGTPGYRVSKTALNAMTKTLAAELGAGGVKINVVCPGWVATDMGTSSAPRTPAQGADSVVWLATLPAAEVPQGRIFRDRAPIDW
jgi:NAD(P)-dependent dehydrogenase (short-subunit alcohol dehydrogenase family)